MSNPTIAEFANAEEAVAHLKPYMAVTCARPLVAQSAARRFVGAFPGTVMYAVKSNPTPALLQALWAGGVRTFDVASIAEVRLVRALLPDATLCFMHPIKPQEAIVEAYEQHGVRAFSLDHQAELDKIFRVLPHAKDLILCVRRRVSSNYAKVSLAAKFGATPNEAADLLVQARQRGAAKIGLCFHVGSQAMDPAAFAEAMEVAEAVCLRANVGLDVLDVGGGFPAPYPGLEPPALEHYFATIAEHHANTPAFANAELWCEPGRALSAGYHAIIARVERRRGDQLYINDGGYGSLSEAVIMKFCFPVRLLRPSSAPMTSFSFYGPTCDDFDFMPGPFSLPDDVAEGDYIELGLTGAYGDSIRTDFNGFRSDLTVQLRDDPWSAAEPTDHPTTSPVRTACA